MRISTILVTLSSFFACAAHAQGTLNTGLLGRFPFDNTTADATGNMGVNSATNAGFGPDAGNRANAALRLTSTGEVWILPNGLLDFGTTGDYSFSVGFKTIASATQAFFTNQSTTTAGGANPQGWFLGFDNSRVGKVYFSLGAAPASAGNGVGLSTQASYNDNAWHTAAVVVNRTANRIQLFVDGVAQPLVNNSPNPNIGAVAGSVFTIGVQAAATANANPGTSLSPSGIPTFISRFGLGFNGSLDEARFYNRALTTSEVATLHALVLASAAEHRGAAALQLFPNPVAARAPFALRLATPVAAASIGLLDAQGRAVAASITPAGLALNASEFTVSGLAPGFYLLRVALPGGVAVRRLVVQ